MFSFFKKKTPEVSPEEIHIPGPGDSTENSNDYVFIENKPQNPNQSSTIDPTNNYMYPPLPSSQYLPPNIPMTSREVNRQVVVNNLDGVPFNMSPAINSENSFENQQSFCDHILATLTRTISVDETKEYDFSLERSVLEEIE